VEREGRKEDGRGKVVVLKISLKYPGTGLTKITVIVCSRHRRRLHARCVIYVPYWAGQLRCGWSKTNALKPFAHIELLTAIRVLSNV